ncbi:MAG: hypothetical protein ACR2G4_06340, partial [Pyrinomonadaceae bacterium]
MTISGQNFDPNSPTQTSFFFGDPFTQGTAATGVHCASTTS